MAAQHKRTIQFVPMTTINKKVSYKETDCSEWVATEKIHGSSFQFFTDDGENVYVASRRTFLDRKGTFLKCNLPEFHQRHVEYVKRLYHAIETDDRWRPYRTMTDMVNDDEEEEVEEEGAAEDETENEKNVEGENVTASDENEDDEPGSNDLQQTATENETKESLELRIYGELYGGGGINKDLKSAVQKEIIYADEFRFYVFGININRKWTTVAEMNDLCDFSGFQYYAVPVCPPKATLEDLTEWLTTSGFMKSKSKLTDKNDAPKTNLEGVVMTPLARKDFGLHAVKLLADAFTDVHFTGPGKTQKPNYCTKARYLSVISKLDLPERENADIVVAMFIADIIKEGGEEEANDNKRKAWTKCVRTWLAIDGYITGEDNQRKGKRESHKQRTTKENVVKENEAKLKDEQDENDEETDIGGLFG